MTDDRPSLFSMPQFSYSDIENRFNYHRPPDDDAAERHAQIRDILREAASDIVTCIEHGVGAAGAREAALMLTKLEEAMFWANAALARNWPTP